MMYRVISIAALSIVLAVPVMLVSYIACLVWISAIPVANRYELWYINSVDGWDLVVPIRLPSGGALAERSLATKVRGIGQSPEGMVVQKEDGTFIVVSSEGQAIPTVAPGGIELDHPSTLRTYFILRCYWWVFGLELLAAIALAAAAGLCRSRTNIQSCV